MNIYDCFMYFDEDMILDLRLNLLDKYVKKFVITESTYLHSGKKKKLNFDFKNFSKFKNKIEYIVIDKPPSNIRIVNENDNQELKNSKMLDNSLMRENHQRNGLIQGLINAHDDDLVVVSDVDEIPNLEQYKYKKKITFFVQKMFYYKFNLLQPNFDWLGSRACKKKDLISCQWLRNIKAKSYSFWRLDAFLSNKKYMNVDFVQNGGWHFTCIKKPKDLHYKLSNFLHHVEYEESGIKIDQVENLINQKKILYDHKADMKDKKYTAKTSLEKVSNETLPEYIFTNYDKYKEWLD
ncbi:MAG: hypothetical protein CBD26_04295 [Candidatus Pelagibacter sp. TMED166]|nr:MAG: hypothetical protein CBD26_04295 [Candidatus Pelagibacter sp. TMED166]